MNDRNAPEIESVEEMVGRFQAELMTVLPKWKDRLAADLSDLEELEDHGDDANEQLQTELAYLRKHGEAGRLKYPYFRSVGLPLGSGAIESSIRRVINLRLKGNGIFWRQDHAEAMLQVRSQVISGRWDNRVKQMRKHLTYDGRTEWSFEPRPMSSKLERAAPSINRPFKNRDFYDDRMGLHPFEMALVWRFASLERNGVDASQVI